MYLVLAAGGCFSVILVLIEMWWSQHGTNLMVALRTKHKPIFVTCGLRGAMVARLTPDQKAACSNHVGVSLHFMLLF